MDKTIYQIPACNMDLLSEKLEALNRKARRFKVAEISTNVVGFEYRDVSYVVGEDEQGNPKYATYKTKFYSVEVVGASIKLEGGWTFAGTLDHGDGGNIVRAVPGIALPESYRTAPKVCDHCGKIRNRKDTYLVRSEAGEFKQVGRSCVRDFLGHTSPERIAWLATLMREIEAVANDNTPRQPQAADALDFMAVAAECVLRKGYVSRAAAKAYAEKSEGAAGLETTAEAAWLQLFPTKEMLRDGKVYPISDEARELGKAAHEWAATLEGSDDFNYNLRTMAQRKDVTRRDSGFLAYAVAGYQKHLGKLAAYKAKQAAFANSQHFGEVGKREVFTLTVLGEHHFEATAYGYGEPQDRILYRMQDASGNVAVWFTSGAKLEVGKTYRLKATVKAHDEYKGIKQTALTRAVDLDEVERDKAVRAAKKAEAKEVVKQAKAQYPGHAWEIDETYLSYGIPQAYCPVCRTTNKAEPVQPCKGDSPCPSQSV